MAKIWAARFEELRAQGVPAAQAHHLARLQLAVSAMEGLADRDVMQEARRAQAEALRYLADSAIEALAELSAKGAEATAKSCSAEPKAA